MHRPATTPALRMRPRLLVLLLSMALGFGLLVTAPPGTADAATCPCTIFTAGQVPGNPSENDPDPAELGVKFRSDSDGFVTGIRFYKGGANTGTHTGSLWTTGGQQLATVTFTGETASGWQQALFAAPVAVTANTTYVASYYAPVGRYAADAGFFASTGVTSTPLTALQNGVDGGNGVYRYGTGGGFPTSTYQSSNYWVDVVFDTSATDTTAPTVTDRQPAPGATAVPVTTGVSATFSEPVQAATISLELTAPGNTAVPSATSYNPGTRTVTLTPNEALSPSTTYTASLSGARDPAGNQMTAVSWTFATTASASGCPCSVWTGSTTPATAAAADSSAVELGVKFRADQDGFVTGIRFYKGPGNSGTHIGSLWSSTGTRLAAVTFAAETASGWQQATFGSPVPVTANTTYVASYYAPVGRYSVNNDYFAAASFSQGPLTALRSGTDGANGVYRYGASGFFPTSSYRSSNYWVDLVFDTSASDTSAPTVLNRAPAAGATEAAINGPVSATFSEAVVPGSVVMELRGPGNAAVAATVSYDGPSRTASLTPSSALAYSTSYTASVSGAKDASNNTMDPVSWSFTTAAPPPPPPDQGPGGPIAVVTSSANLYSKYLAEILRTEGLNEFATVDVATLSASSLAAYDVVVLGAVSISSSQAADLASWVNAGGNLIAIKPAGTLSGLLGLTAATGTTTNGYLKVDPATSPGAGIVSQTIQYHGPADRYTLSGAQAVATIYSNATTATTFPAVTLRGVGSNGGQAAAFTFDLPRSIVLTRQGNPAWAGQERDGQSPIRSDDLYFGGTATDWVNLNKVAIPQADEQQRLLTNLIQVMNRDRKPLPRFWYFPRGLKAVVIGTGDDHGNGGTAGRFDQYAANSPAGCSPADWTCLRFTSYIYPGTPLSDAAAAAYQNAGFEVGLHPSNGCTNFTAASLASTYAGDLASWRSNFPSVSSPLTNRMHCLVWSDWASQAKTEVANGMRLDSNYYYWPGSWIQNRPGFMTGSGMPMRFAETDGSMIDIYQSATQMTDESGQTYPFTPNTLLDNALGPPGYYGAFNVNMHTDQVATPQSDALIASAQQRNVPIVSGRQMAEWLDGRNASSFSGLSWGGNTLSFGIAAGANATGLTAMLPIAGPGGSQLTGITRAGSPVTYTTELVKGLDYASFAAEGGAYTASYAVPGTFAIAGTEAVARVATTESGAADQTATLSWTTTTTATSEVSLGVAAGSLSLQSVQREATRRHAITVKGLKPATKYYYRITSTDTGGARKTWPAAGLAPATFTTPRADLTKPTVTESAVTALPDGTALVRWTTSEPSAGVIRWGRGSTGLTLTAQSPAVGRSHSVLLSQLKPDRTYWISTEATDAAGNQTITRARRFASPSFGVAEQLAASFARGSTSGNAKVEASGSGSVTLGGGKSVARSGTFVSGLLDAQAMVDWDRGVRQTEVPAGSTLTLSVRTGSTATPDGTWSDWRTVDGRGRIKGSSRFVQYRVDMTAAATATAPSLYAVGFSHNGVPVEHEKEGR